jgi:hypothetical protein
MNWQGTEIIFDGDNQPQFNYQLLQHCFVCENKGVFRDPRVFVYVPVFSVPSSRRWALGPPQRRVSPRLFLLATGVDVSVLQTEIAVSLGLPPSRSVRRVNPICHVRGDRERYCCVHEVLLQFGGYCLQVEAAFPVIPGGGRDRHQYDKSWPKYNIIGAQGLLGSHVLCLTPSKVYGFSEQEAIVGDTNGWRLRKHAAPEQHH